MNQAFWQKEISGPAQDRAGEEPISLVRPSPGQDEV